MSTVSHHGHITSCSSRMLQGHQGQVFPRVAASVVRIAFLPRPPSIDSGTLQAQTCIWRSESPPRIPKHTSLCGTWHSASFLSHLEEWERLSFEIKERDQVVFIIEKKNLQIVVQVPMVGKWLNKFFELCTMFRPPAISKHKYFPPLREAKHRAFAEMEH